MPRHLTLWVAALGLGYCIAGATQAQSPSGETFYRQRVLDAWTAAESGADSRADRLLGEVIGDPDFEALPLDERRQLLSRAAWAAARNARRDAATERYRQLAALGSDDPDDWYRMALVALEGRDFDAAARAMTVMIGRWPELLVNVSPDVLYPLVHQGDNDAPDRIAYLQALFDANWKGGTAGAPDAVWFKLARARLEQGDDARARIVARRIGNPGILISMRADRRFDPLLDRDGWRANVSHAAERGVERARTLVSAHPDKLEPVTALGYQLLFAGRHEDMLALADDTLARIAAAPLDSPAFTDLHQQVWLMNYKSIALRRLGRVDEAVEELRRASRLGENGGMNVSQALNLATIECDRGNADAALEAASMAARDGMSDYGRAVEASVRHCVAQLRDDRSGARRALADLAALRDEAPLAYLAALLNADRADEAVAQARHILDAADLRNELLDWAQDCQLPEPLPTQSGERARKRAFLQRDDVLSAINAVGRIESYDVFCHLLD